MARLVATVDDAIAEYAMCAVRCCDALRPEPPQVQRICVQCAVPVGNA